MVFQEGAEIQESHGTQFHQQRDSVVDRANQTEGTPNTTVQKRQDPQSSKVDNTYSKRGDAMKSPNNKSQEIMSKNKRDAIKRK